MYILLPPSEGKLVSGGKSSFAARHPERVFEVRPVLDYLAKLAPDDLPKFYGMKSSEMAVRVHADNLASLDAPALPALTRYTGVVYGALDYATLPNKAAARKRALIVSSLFGLSEGGCPLPYYKLSMTPWLAKYWAPINSARLAEMAGGKPVLNLLSQTYAKAIAYPSLITVDFRVEGGQKAAGHFGKAIKGRFVRWMLENGVKKARDFHGFSEEGYQFDGANFIQQGRPVRGA